MRLFGQGPDGGFGQIDEIIKFQEIPWRISTDSQFGETDQVGTLLPGNSDGIGHLLQVPGEISDVVIELSKSDTHGG